MLGAETEHTHEWKIRLRDALVARNLAHFLSEPDTLAVYHTSKRA
jgi:hypothetical protein